MTDTEETRSTKARRMNIYIKVEDEDKLLKFRQHLLAIHKSFSKWVNEKMDEEIAAMGGEQNAPAI